MNEAIFNPYKHRSKNISLKQTVANELAGPRTTNLTSFGIFRKKGSRLAHSFTAGQSIDSGAGMTKQSSFIEKPQKTDSNPLEPRTGPYADMRSNPSFGETSELQKPARKSLARQMILNPATSLFSSLAGVSKRSRSINKSVDGGDKLKKDDLSPSEGVKVKLAADMIDKKEELKTNPPARDPQIENKRSVLQSLIRAGPSRISGGGLMAGLHKKTKSNATSFLNLPERTVEKSPNKQTE